MLGMAVRSVQLMVDREELEAWKTPGGHRRISRASVEKWLASRKSGGEVKTLRNPSKLSTQPSRSAGGRTKILLIEDSTHFQNLVSMLVHQHFPDASLLVADDGIAGLAMYGQYKPDVLIVDILLPGIDGPTLITTLRSHPQFAQSQLVVITSLDAAQCKPFEFALQGVRVIHKSELMMELPAALIDMIGEPLEETAAHALD